MFIPVDITIEPGEIVYGYSLPYISDEGNIVIDYVQNLVEKVNQSTKMVKPENYKQEIPFHRVIQFTFGGVMLENEEYSEEEKWEEDKRVIRKLKLGVK